ncbi:MAG: ABC transporter permease [Bacteroidetes bacterium]|nr:ABC transporter permease [Bacteroidota bacterium]
MLYIKIFWSFIATLYKQKYVIGQLVKRDFQNKYLGSYLGLPWAFIQPGMIILVMWFAFTYGFKMTVTDNGLPFVPWFICGMIPWLFISEILSSSSGSLVEYKYLILKTSFWVSMIPLVKIFTGFIIHFFFIVVIAVLMISNGIYPSLYWLQIIYYLFATFVLLLGLGWLFSSLNVFVRDISQIINVGISIIFWATPIMWSFSRLPGNMRYIALFNPFFYITEGYRFTFLQKTWFFFHWEMTIYFWCVTLFIFILGATVFRKLTPHFADVL